MPEPQQSFQRQIAYKVRISDILSSRLNKENMFLYVIVNNLNVSRVNIISTLVYKDEDASYASAIIDDGTGRISVRGFESKYIFSKIDVGDIILIIGKIREFNDERFIVPEIIKKINNQDWVKVRNIELRNNVITKIENVNSEESLIEDNLNSADDVLSLIRKLDSGEGVLIDDVLKESKNDGVEKTLSKMLENGDIFEIKPGKIKILE